MIVRSVPVCYTQNGFITWVSKIIWKFFLSEFPQSKERDTCPRKIICNTCKKINVSGDIFNSSGNFEEQEYYRFTGSLFKKAPIIIYDNTNKKLIKMNRTPIFNIYEEQLNNPICENID